MSVIASALKHMLAAGMPADAIVAAVAEMEASLAHDPVAEKRRAYDRERKRVSRSNMSTGHPPESADIADKADTPPSLSPSPLLPPDPQQPPAPIPTPAMGTPARKGTRLAEDWEPEPIIGNAGSMVENWPPGAMDRELEKFRNYWLAKPGKDAAKTNWQRTWINWLMTADERIGRHGTGNGSSASGRGSVAEALHAARNRCGFG